MVIALSAGAARGTTLIREGVDQLTVESETIVVARVVDIHSYWNASRDFILTDVRLRPSQTLKGRPADDLTLTVMGGSVGEVTTLLIGGPDLVPGSDYVLFLTRGSIRGAEDRLTIRSLAQGIFEVRKGRAFSQATDEALLPDAGGQTEVPGGTDGLVLDDLVGLIRANSNR